MSKTPMTHFGAEALRAELDQLKKVERPRIIEAIAVAREHGDLKENAEYHAAREEQGFVEGRIKDIESKLSNAQVIDVRKIENTGKVIFGVTVTVEDLETEERSQWMIVGEDEADIAHRKISVSSPMARAMIGKEEGDVVTVSAPKGDVEYEILGVEHL
jgi:transcription elongation factor GreA